MTCSEPCLNILYISFASSTVLNSIQCFTQRMLWNSNCLTKQNALVHRQTSSALTEYFNYLCKTRLSSTNHWSHKHCTITGENMNSAANILWVTYMFLIIKCLIRNKSAFYLLNKDEFVCSMFSFNFPSPHNLPRNQLWVCVVCDSNVGLYALKKF